MWLLFGMGCGNEDFVDAPLELDEWDHGWLAVIEPGEELDVGLRGNVLDPDVAWQVVEYDAAVIELQGQEHQMPRADVAGLDDEDTGDPLLSHTLFFFSGAALGDTPLVFELVVDDVRLDVAEFTVRVVEDACDSETGATANRCGRDFSFHPQDLTELDYGRSVALEPGDELEVVLAANALYPESPWEVVDFDAEVIDVDGPVRAEANRSPGDWEPWEPGARHSFLATWTLTIVGVALGESPLVLEIRGDGERVDAYELALAVVEDACAVDAGISTCEE